MTCGINTKGWENWSVIVQYFLLGQTCLSICCISLSTTQTKFRTQAVEIIFLRNEHIIVGCFVSPNNSIFITKFGKSINHIRFIENIGSLSGHTDMYFYQYQSKLGTFANNCYSLLLSTIARSPVITCLTGPYEIFDIKQSHESMFCLSLILIIELQMLQDPFEVENFGCNEFCVWITHNKCRFIV